MTEPLSWIWAARSWWSSPPSQPVCWPSCGSCAAGPTWHHVITHEVNKSWEEIKAEIEARERGNGPSPSGSITGLTTSARTALPRAEAVRLRHDRRAATAHVAAVDGAAPGAIVDGS